jgi:hypothetical protein
MSPVLPYAASFASQARCGLAAVARLRPGGRVTQPPASELKQLRGEAKRAVGSECVTGSMYLSLAKWPAGPCGCCERSNAWCCIEALCFGDFHLGQQMKVTRLPGRDPAGSLAN